MKHERHCSYANTNLAGLAERVEAILQERVNLSCFFRQEIGIRGIGIAS
jgi:hypothetical protein